MADYSRLPAVLDPFRKLIHPAALIVPRPSEAECAALKSDITVNGMLTPLAIFIDGNGDHWLLDGVSRLQVLVEIGSDDIPDEAGHWPIPTTPYSEADGHDPYEIALSLNVTRRHLSGEQKREVVAAVLKARPDLSDRAIAKMARVDDHTVASVRANAEIPHKPEAALETDAETETDTPTTEPAPPPPERREASGRRARGRKPGSRTASPSQAGSEAGIAAEDTPRREPSRPEVRKWFDQYLGWTRSAQATARMFVFNAEEIDEDALAALPFEEALDLIAAWHKEPSDDERQQFNQRFALRISRGMIKP